MAFQVNLNLEGTKSGKWVLDPHAHLVIPTETGRYQATFSPDTGSENSVDSYSLTLVENGDPPNLKDPIELDYQFKVEHATITGETETLEMDRPHTLSMQLTGKALKVALTIQEPVGKKINRAHLTLTDEDAAVATSA